jgi:phosphomannomutase
MRELVERYSDGKIGRLEGSFVDRDHWHSNVRPSNTPLLRLNLESLVSREHMTEKRDYVLALIRA